MFIFCFVYFFLGGGLSDHRHSKQTNVLVKRSYLPSTTCCTKLNIKPSLKLKIQKQQLLFIRTDVVFVNGVFSVYLDN